jgi:hypothetical protein
VRGGPGGLPETLAEIFCPFPGPLPRRLYLRLLDALFAVGPVPELPESFACLRVQNILHRFFDGLTAPVRSGLRLANPHEGPWVRWATFGYYLTFPGFLIIPSRCALPHGFLAYRTGALCGFR